MPTTLRQLLSPFGRAFFTSVRILALPAIEFLFFRLYLKHVLGLKFGWEGFTDFDFIFSLPLSLTIAVYTLHNSGTFHARFSLNWLRINLLLSAAFLILNNKFEMLTARDPEFIVLAWTFLAGAVMLSALFSQIDPQMMWKHPGRWVYLPMILIASSTFYAKILMRSCWPLFSRMAAFGTCGILGSAFSNVECLSIMNREELRLIVRHPLFGASIGKACGGLEAYFLFGYFILIMATLNPKRFRKSQWGWVVLSGFPLIYALNVLRICLLFCMGAFLPNLIGRDLANRITLTFFHTHGGWLLFLVGIILHLHLADRIFAPAREVASRYVSSLVEVES
jgi:exosortase/archaeosortase family protein